MAKQGEGRGKRVVVLGEQALIAMFQRYVGQMEFRPELREGLPDDAQVERVIYSFERLAFLICLSSAEWEPVEPGMVIPVLEAFETARMIVWRPWSDLVGERLARAEERATQAFWDAEKAREENVALREEIQRLQQGGAS